MIPSGLLQISGASGTGKTQFCLDLVLTFLAAKPTRKCFFVYTKGIFPLDRLSEMALSRGLDDYEISKIIEKLNIASIHSFSEVEVLVRKLKEAMVVNEEMAKKMIGRIEASSSQAKTTNDIHFQLRDNDNQRLDQHLDLAKEDVLIIIDSIAGMEIDEVEVKGKKPEERQGKKPEERPSRILNSNRLMKLVGDLKTLEGDGLEKHFHEKLQRLEMQKMNLIGIVRAMKIGMRKNGILGTKSGIRKTEVVVTKSGAVQKRFMKIIPKLIKTDSKDQRNRPKTANTPCNIDRVVEDLERLEFDLAMKTDEITNLEKRINRLREFEIGQRRVVLTNHVTNCDRDYFGRTLQSRENKGAVSSVASRRIFTVPAMGLAFHYACRNHISLWKKSSPNVYHPHRTTLLTTKNDLFAQSANSTRKTNTDYDAGMTHHSKDYSSITALQQYNGNKFDQRMFFIEKTSYVYLDEYLESTGNYSENTRNNGKASYLKPCDYGFFDIHPRGIEVSIQGKQAELKEPFWKLWQSLS